MKHGKHKKNILLLSIAILAITVGIFLCFDKWKPSFIFKNKQAQNVPNKNNLPKDPLPSTEKTDQNSNSQQSNSSKIELENISIPIIMYHHIRDFNDPNDKIGTNLSVPTSKFKEQLDLIKSKGYNTITFKDILEGNIPDKPIVLTFDDGYKNFYTNAFPELRKRNMKGVTYIITNYIGNGDYMNKEEIKEVYDYGIEVGSHTLSHPDLSKASKEKATNEISQSKQIIEGIIGQKIISFCYPSGKFTDETETIIKDLGYNFAVTTKSGITTFKDPFALNRYRMNNDSNISSYLK